jgi:carboxyl-terminal processing protease
MRLTTATYWRPSGKNIHRSRKATDDDEWGVTPAKKFQVSFNDEEAELFVKSQRERFAAPINGDETETADAFVDRQLELAIQYVSEQLQGVDAAQPPEPAVLQDAA